MIGTLFLCDCPRFKILPNLIFFFDIFKIQNGQMSAEAEMNAELGITELAH